MSKIIIGIHGLENKPPEKLLGKWWKKAISEGLQAIEHPNAYFDFELVYWADIFYPRPLNPLETDRKSPFYLDEPYARANNSIRNEPSKFRRKVLDILEKQLDRLLLRKDLTSNFSGITDMILRRFFKDLTGYYGGKYQIENHDSEQAKKVIREKLANLLYNHREKEIMLIAHSMGSIIAYDVLVENVDNFQVDTFITIGSPLGLPVIMGKIAAERGLEKKGRQKLTTPENVMRNWCNFSDLNDKITYNYNLADDYDQNTRKVQAIDYIVSNDYEIDGAKNPHKVFGYLRTPEISRVIREFLSRGESEARIWLVEKVSRIKAALLGEND